MNDGLYKSYSMFRPNRPPTQLSPVYEKISALASKTSYGLSQRGIESFNAGGVDYSPCAGRAVKF
ncbi:MAG: hypothetical protein HQK64_00470 [Desulfamplus sp.]|nr:hypothetical protein [Desulfamplus sp.]